MFDDNKWVEGLRVWKLKDDLQARGLSTSGKKLALIARLQEAMSEDALLLVAYLKEEEEEAEEGYQWLNGQEIEQKEKERERKEIEEEAGHRIPRAEPGFAFIPTSTEMWHPLSKDTLEKVREIAQTNIKHEKATLRNLKELVDRKQKMKIASLYALETITDEIDECNRVILRKEEGIARKEVAASLFNDAFN